MFRPLRILRALAPALVATLLGAAAFAAGPPVLFPNLDAAKKAITDDRLEPYFSTLQPLEMAAKTGRAMSAGTLAAQQEECRARYREGMVEYTAEEKEAVSWYVNKLLPILAAEYPLVANAPWSYLKVQPTIEGGLPHTRGEHVVFSKPVLQHLMQMRRAAPEQAALGQGGELILHEHLHVVQRLHPEIFARLYTTLWNFRHAERIETTAWLTAHHLSNPDGVDCRWVFPLKAGAQERVILPLVVFGDVAGGVPRMPQDFVMTAVSITPKNSGFAPVLGADGRPEMTPLMSLTEYTRMFPGCDEIFHPNELSAELFARVVVFDHFVNKAQIPKERLDAIEKSLAPLRAWFRQNLR